MVQTWQNPRLADGPGRRREHMNWRHAKFFILAAIFLGGSLGAGAQETANKEKASPSKPNLDLAVKAMFGVHEFAQAAISPDGKRVAWVESLPGPGGAPSANSAIQVAALGAPEAKKRITAGDGKAAHEEHDVAWSPDSKSVAFCPMQERRGSFSFSWRERTAVARDS